MSRLDILAHLAAVPQDVPDVVAAGESLKKVYDRHVAIATDSGGELQVVALTAEEEAHVATIAAAFTAEGSQAAFDPSRLIGIVTFLAQNPAVWAAILSLFRKG